MNDSVNIHRVDTLWDSVTEQWACGEVREKSQSQGAWDAAPEHGGLTGLEFLKEAVIPPPQNLCIFCFFFLKCSPPDPLPGWLLFIFVSQIKAQTPVNIY